MVKAELGFTSDVIRDPHRFVGRTELISDCIKALNAPTGCIAVYGRRGVGKSSVLRQIQQMSLGDYTLAREAGLHDEIPEHPRTYLTIYYTCDAWVGTGVDLLSRLCNDQDDKEGLLRLVPDDGKELMEFVRTRELKGGTDLRIVNWGIKGVQTSRYARAVPGDSVQTFRNFVHAIVTHQVKKFMHRDALLILLDEFDQIREKVGLGSFIKSLSSPEVKIGICGLGDDLVDLVKDHGSLGRLLEQGTLHVPQMTNVESIGILNRAEELFEGKITFEPETKYEIARISEGYPYFTQLIGRACVIKANRSHVALISRTIFDRVLKDIQLGRAFPVLESDYRRAIGNSEQRQLVLLLLAEQPEDKASLHEESGRVSLKMIRKDAQDMYIHQVDQLLQRLLDEQYGPVLRRAPDSPGVYTFVDPVFRLYVRLRHF